MERGALEARVAASEAAMGDPLPQEAHDFLTEIRARLDAGLTDEQRAEIVRLLVRIVIHTDLSGPKKTVKAAVTFRFPAVVSFFTGIREEVNYTTVRRVIELPVGRQKVAVG
jgi:hypothetical protein